MKQKRLVTIQDLSCFGKCSLTVALPVISALGIETAVIPTAVLSTHTGECFHDYTFCTLEGELDKISASWQKGAGTMNNNHNPTTGGALSSPAWHSAQRGCRE